MNGTGQPLITVVIPVFNKRPYIAKAINSVLNQTYPYFEVLIIDDGSTDDCAAVLSDELRDRRVRLIRQNNAGEGAARNRGLDEMRGDIAAFLDADDRWLPRHLADIVDLASRFPTAGFFATGYRSVFRGGFTTETTIDKPVPTFVADYFAFATGAHPVHISSAAIRKTVVDAVGGFTVGEPYGADLEYYARVAVQYHLAYCPEISSVYTHQLPQSAMSSFQWNAVIPLVVRTIDGYAASRSLPASARAYARWVLREFAICGLGAGQKSVALEMLSRSTGSSHTWAALWARCCPGKLLRLVFRARRCRLFARRERRSGDVVVRRVECNGY